jgi:addiction module RelE/StbE family toxin
MAHEIIWFPDAVRDLQSIAEYLSQYSPAIANTVADRLMQAIDRLESVPFSGSVIRDWKQTRYRHLVVVPYRIIYRVDPPNVYIVTIVHSARDLKQLMRRRRLRT